MKSIVCLYDEKQRTWKVEIKGLDADGKTPVPISPREFNQLVRVLNYQRFLYQREFNLNARKARNEKMEAVKTLV